MKVVRSAIHTGRLYLPGNITGTRIMPMKHHRESDPRPSGLWRSASSNCSTASPVCRRYCSATYYTPFLSSKIDISSPVFEPAISLLMRLQKLLTAFVTMRFVRYLEFVYRLVRKKKQRRWGAGVAQSIL
jgi:hypothetical protein